MSTNVVDEGSTPYFAVENPDGSFSDVVSDRREGVFSGDPNLESILTFARTLQTRIDTLTTVINEYDEIREAFMTGGNHGSEIFQSLQITHSTRGQEAFIAQFAPLMEKAQQNREELETSIEQLAIIQRFTDEEHSLPVARLNVFRANRPPPNRPLSSVEQRLIARLKEAQRSTGAANPQVRDLERRLEIARRAAARQDDTTRQYV